MGSMIRRDLPAAAAAPSSRPPTKVRASALAHGHVARGAVAERALGRAAALVIDSSSFHVASRDIMDPHVHPVAGGEQFHEHMTASAAAGCDDFAAGHRSPRLSLRASSAARCSALALV